MLWLVPSTFWRVMLCTNLGIDTHTHQPANATLRLAWSFQPNHMRLARRTARWTAELCSTSSDEGWQPIFPVNLALLTCNRCFSFSIWTWFCFIARIDLAGFVKYKFSNVKWPKQSAQAHIFFWQLRMQLTLYFFVYLTAETPLGAAPSLGTLDGLAHMVWKRTSLRVDIVLLNT